MSALIILPASNSISNNPSESTSLPIQQTVSSSGILEVYSRLFAESTTGYVIFECPQTPLIVNEAVIIQANKASEVLTSCSWSLFIGQAAAACSAELQIWMLQIANCVNQHSTQLVYLPNNTYIKLSIQSLSLLQFAVCFEDVTADTLKIQQSEERARQAQTQAVHCMSFLSNMSHEIRTPLNGIAGFIQLLLNQHNLSEDKKNSYFEMVRFSSEQLIRVVNDIIDIAKIESNQLVLKPTECSINTVVDNMQLFAEIEQQRLKRFDLKILNTKALSAAKSLIWVDGVRLRQVLYNLLNNAIKFCPEGSVSFGYQYIEPNKELLFFVRDTGIGIPKCEQNTIFERFKQANNNLEISHNGAGLGLAICSHLIELMNGKIWLESEEDKGSVFWFTIPYRTVPLEK